MKKIGIIVDCLSNGGAEKMAASLSQVLNNNGYCVSIITIRNEITYQHAGKVYNLGLNEATFKPIKQLKKLILFKKYYQEINADLYIDFRMRNRFSLEYLLTLFVFNMKKMVFTIHSYNILYHLPKSGFLLKKMNASKVVVISKKALEKTQSVYHFKNVNYIPNFYTNQIINTTKDNPFKNPFILFVGRLENNIKQIDKLIITYKKSIAKQHGIKLYILGDGTDKANLQKLIVNENLEEQVKLLGFVEKPETYMKYCEFLVLSSKFEGFPMVLIETLANGKPVISFNCNSGPSEIITNKNNGLLVEDQNFEKLQDAINNFISNTKLYNTCKANAASSVLKFSEKEVFKKWERLINET